MRIYISIEAPHRWVRVDRQGKAGEVGTADALDAPSIPVQGAMVVGVVPGADVTVHEVDIPARQRAKVAAAIPFALEDSLSADIDTLHFSLLKWSPGSPAIAGVVSRDKMDDWLQAAADAGLTLDAIVPDHMLLPIHNQSRMTIARGDDGLVNIREANESALTLDPDLFRYWWQDLEDKGEAIAVNDVQIAKLLLENGGSQVSEWKIGNNFVHWLNNHDDPPSLDSSLMSGEFAPVKRDGWSWAAKAAAIVCGVALALKLGFDGAEYFWLKQRSAELDNQIQAIWADTFPNAGPVDPFTAKVQMQNRSNDVRSGLTGSGDLQVLLAQVSRAIPQSSAQIEEINFRDNELLLTCSMADFAQLDQLQKSIEATEGVSVELINSSKRDDRVRGQFKLRRAGV